MLGFFPSFQLLSLVTVSLTLCACWDTHIYIYFFKFLKDVMLDRRLVPSWRESSKVNYIPLPLRKLRSSSWDGFVLTSAKDYFTTPHFTSLSMLVLLVELFSESQLFGQLWSVVNMHFEDKAFIHYRSIRGSDPRCLFPRPAFFLTFISFTRDCLQTK